MVMGKSRLLFVVLAAALSLSMLHVAFASATPSDGHTPAQPTEASSGCRADPALDFVRLIAFGGTASDATEECPPASERACHNTCGDPWKHGCGVWCTWGWVCNADPRNCRCEKAGL